MQRKHRIGIVCLALALALRTSSTLRRKLVLAALKLNSTTHFTLSLARVLLGHIFPPIVHFWMHVPRYVAQDDCQVLQNLEYKRRHYRYGPHHREQIDTLTPCEGQATKVTDALDPSGFVHFCADFVVEFTRTMCGNGPKRVPPGSDGKAMLEDAPVILFGHGGGWVCPGTEVHTHQVTPLARAGYKVFAYNYPLAPEDKFPTALVSTLKVLTWLYTEQGVRKVALVGESAGGNLTTMAAALLQNRRLLKELSEETGIPLDTWVYPEITCMVSWYSILCSEHWREAGWLSPGMKKVYDLYCSDTFGNRVALMDLEEDIISFPPSLLIAGTRDPLGLAESSVQAHNMLQRKKLVSKLSLYDDTHGFVSFPVQLQQALTGESQNPRDATYETIEWLKKYHKKSYVKQRI